jgi:hypothetical protein
VVEELGGEEFEGGGVIDVLQRGSSTSSRLA